MRRDPCPSDAMLAAFHFGDLPEALLDALRVHQESCPRCESKARELDYRTDPLIDDLRRTARRPDLPGGDAAGAGGPPAGGPAGPRDRRRPGADRDRPGSDPDPGPDPDPNTATGPVRPADAAGRDLPRLPDYEIIEPPLGEGGTGIVYRARHLKLGRVVALKMIAGTSSKVSALFQIEAKAVAQLQHPNIVQIFEIGHHEGQPFLALEFVEGGSLDRKIAGGPRPPRAAAELVRTLALAADHAHRQGIVHCDLKPSNILLTPEGVPKIADFGVAKWLESDDHWGPDGEIMGTPRYMAPEQASGRIHSVGPATDVYSLGVILYEMVTGRTPHPPAPPLETLALVCEQEPVPPRQLRPKLPRDLETIILKCLRKDPSRRYDDARALAEDLARHLSGAPILARPVGPAGRPLFWARRHPTAVVVLLIGALGMASFGLVPRHPAPTPRREDAERRRTEASSAAAAAEAAKEPARRRVDTIVQTDGSIRLGAASASIAGDSLVFESPFGNLGYWHSDNDRASWNFRVEEPATFTLSFDYSCDDRSAGNSYEVRVDGARVVGEVASTGAWWNYKFTPIGALELPAGPHRLEIRPGRPIRGALFDLRAVTLIPRERSARR